MSRELDQYRKIEYRQPGDFDLHIHDFTHQKPGLEKPPTPAQVKAGIFLQRHVFAPIDKKRAPLVDRIEAPISEIAIGIAKAALVVDAEALVYLLGRILKYSKMDSDFNVGLALAPFALIVIGGSYALTHRDELRSLYENYHLHPSRELGLEPSDLSERNLEDDLDLCIAGMNRCVGSFN